MHRIRCGAVLLGLAAVGLFAGGTGCGPSFQAVYECDVRFEHCYALDQQAVVPDAKKQCWREWLHGYTYGQSRDRVEYAATRFSELSLDPTLPSEDTASRPRRPHNLTAPLPTSAFAPPPNLAGDGTVPPAMGQSPQQVVAAGSTPHVVPASSQAPGEQCTEACAQRWNACRKGCTDGACETCDGAYKACVPGCFQDVRQVPRSLR
jgi:hypothetical protein